MTRGWITCMTAVITCIRIKPPSSSPAAFAPTPSGTCRQNQIEDK